VISETDWNAFIETCRPDAHLLQTGAWGRLKSAFGWRAEPLRKDETGALVLFRPLPLGFSIAYLPRGPVPSDAASLAGLLPQLDGACRSRRAVFLKIEPDAAIEDFPDSALRRIGFQPSPNTIQPPQTILVDLQGSEDDLLARMKSKTRYNIRLAARHGVTAVRSEDIGLFTRLMDATGRRDSFAIHSESYYREAFAAFRPRQNAALWLAEYRGEPISGLMAFAQGRRAWYLFGASSDLHREVMAPYLLQWEAIRWARSRGCTEYDLWGIPDADAETLERQFTSRRDGLWGVYRFKRGFGGRIWRSVGAWDRVYHPLLYGVYRLLVARRSRALG
jgi:lipid II:glycine glycyltransferase (peptidoglycan interpeptide bridge formation enzyme)